MTDHDAGHQTSAIYHHTQPPELTVNHHHHNNSMTTDPTPRGTSLEQTSSAAVRNRQNQQNGSAVDAKPGGRGAGGRSHKNRSSGAFLLSGPLFDGASSDYVSTTDSRWSRQTLTSATSQPRGGPLPVSPTATTPEPSPRTSPRAKAGRSSKSSLPPGDSLRKRPASSAQKLDTQRPDAAVILSQRDVASSSSVAITPQPVAAPPHDHSSSSYLHLARPGALPPPTASSARSSSPSPRHSLDLDSTQIVNMALSLSESRRLAARRNVSQPMPPTLAPMPDGSLGGSLRQHLQQQRRSSRNISPRPPRNTAPPSLAAPVAAAQQPTRISSPLHASFDLGAGDNSGYRYHFSPSTLARAQKAKDHLELLAQYRRALDFVPPLKPGYGPRPGGAADTSVASAAADQARFTNEFLAKLGRRYNPLQYIRNRKVRARERKAIDGDAQGFGDVRKVTEWVDDLAGSASIGPPRNSILPTFAPAEEYLGQEQLQQQQQQQQKNKNASSSGPVASSAGPLTPAKSKRPRVDWVINPADLLADMYWLEQGDNKKYVEDRNYKRVFPQGPPGTSRPWSSPHKDGAAPMASPGGAIAAAIAAVSAAATSAAAPAPATTTIKETLELGRSSSSSDHRPSSVEIARLKKDQHGLQQVPAATREKLERLRGLHHRHSSSVQAGAQELMRLRRGSISDESDSESGPRKKRLARTQTITASGRDTLERQMLDMIAQENRASIERREAVPAVKEADAAPSRPSAGVVQQTPPQRRKPAPAVLGSWQSLASSQEGSRDGATTMPAVDAIGRGRVPYRLQGYGPASPGSPGQGRDSLEVPSFWGARPGRPSVEYDSSQPTSPDLGAVQGSDDVPDFILPPIGKDLSPTHSRSGSPSRNPFSRVKQKLQRERSRSRVRGVSDVARDSSRATTPGVFLDEKQPWLGSTPDLKKSPPKGWPAPESLQQPSPATRERTGSPVRKPTLKKAQSNEKPAAKSQSSTEPKREDSGFRGLLSRGPPRIDSVLRSGVSKVGDLLWRRESSTDATTPSAAAGNKGSKIATAADDSGSSDSEGSGTDATRGSSRKADKANRNGGPERESKQVSHATAEDASRSLAPPPDPMLSPDLDSPVSRPPSRRSARFELLKPPRLDVQAATPTTPGSSPVFPKPYAEDGRQRGGGEGREGALLIKHWPPPRPTATATAGGAGRRGALDQRSVLRQRVWAVRSGILASEMLCRARGSAAQQPGTGGATAWRRNEALAAAAAEMQQVARQWHQRSELFAGRTVPSLVSRIDELRARVAVDLMSLVRAAADEADDIGRDLVDGRRLQVKRVVDVIEKLLRRRRRRLRWVRRAGWLVVEWWLVGFMWFVWAVVVVARMFLGLGKGIVGVGRWLLWL